MTMVGVGKKYLSYIVVLSKGTKMNSKIMIPNTIKQKAKPFRKKSCAFICFIRPEPLINLSC